MNLGAEGLKGNKNIWRDQLVVLSHLPDCKAVRFQDPLLTQNIIPQILSEILMGLQRRNMFNIKQSLMVGKRFRLSFFWCWKLDVLSVFNNVSFQNPNFLLRHSCTKTNSSINIVLQKLYVKILIVPNTSICRYIGWQNLIYSTYYTIYDNL